MSSSTTELCSLLFETGKEYEKNLQTLLTLIKNAPNNSIIVAPEVCLTGFDYENINKAVAFSIDATQEIKKHSQDKIIILTMLATRNEEIFNLVKVFYNGEVIHERPKARLFRFGNEDKYMSEGLDEEIKIIEIAGVKIAVLVCFELRFKELWKLCEGADVIAIPSWWGVLRSEHFKTLTQALAIMNQCYVIASDSLNAECSKLSAIITPQGKVTQRQESGLLKEPYSQKEIKLMRRYLDVGIESF